MTNQELERQEELSDLEFVMSTDQGRRFVMRLLTHCRYWEDNWTPNATIHFNTAIRSVAVKIMDDIYDGNLEHMEFQMRKEAKERLKLQELKDKEENHDD